MAKKVNPRKFRIIFGLILLIVLVIFVGLKLWANKKVNAAWFDANWAFRQKIPVTAHTGSETSVYMTPNTFDSSSSSKFQADCGDLRFTDINGKSLQYYIVSGCGSGTTTVHVLIPNFPSGAQDFYMYYGNPIAPNGFSSSDFVTAATGVTLGSNGSEENGVGPAAYWKFDEGTGQNVNDSTSRVNTGTLGADSTPASDDPTWQTEDQCISGKCLSFDGSNDYVLTNTNSTIFDATSNSVTISAWINPTATGNVIISKGGGPALGGWLLSYSSSSKITFTLKNTGSNVVQYTANATTPLNTWTHVEVVFRVDTATLINNTVSLYLNGNLDTASVVQTSLPAVSTAKVKIGARGEDATPTLYWPGKIDDVKIYTYARNSSQILADYDLGAEQLGKKNQQNFLSNGLVGYWKMDETSWTNDCSTTSVSDSSGNGINGKSCPNSTGPTGAAAAKFGNGGSFDGSDDYINLGTSSLGNKISGTNGVTLSSWINVTSMPAGRGRIINSLIDSTNTTGIELALNGSTVEVGARSLNTDSFQAVTTAFSSTNSWHLLTGVINYSKGTIAIYIDGALSVETAVTFANKTYTLGTATGFDSLGSEGTPTNFFKGKMDNVRVYNRILSGNEIASLYSWAPGPVGYWNFDENTGTTASDSSGNGNAGTITAGNGGFVNGKFGYGYNFDAANTKIDAGSGATLDNLKNTAGLSAEAWVYPKSTGEGGANGGVIIGKATGPTNSVTNGWFLFVTTGNTLKFTYDGATDLVRLTSTTLSLNTWSHIVVTWDGSTTATNSHIYINGIEAAYTTSTNGVTLTSDASTNLIIGNDSTQADTFDGYIDDAKIYNYARTQGQIIEDMNGNHPLGGSPIGSQIAYYKFDEGRGQTINNSVLNQSALNGTLGVDSSSASDDPTWKPATSGSCKTNGCLNFDGSNDVANIYSSAMNTAFNGSEGAITGWVQVSGSGVWTDGTTRNLILIGVDASTNFVTINKNSASNAMVFNYVSGSTTSSISKTPISDTGWIYVAFTWSKSNDQVKAYINGQLIGTQTGLGTWSGSLGSTRTVIGAASSAGSQPWSGNIDEIKIYNTPLTAEQIKIDYNAGATENFGATSSTEASILGDGSGNAPVGYWNFEENTGGTANDASGNGNTGTFTNSPSWIVGKIGTGIDIPLSGTDKNVSITHASTIDNLSALTVSAWAYPRTAGTSNIGRLVQKGNDSTEGWAIRTSATKTVKFVAWFNGGTNLAAETAANALTFNAWNHITVSWDGSSTAANVKIYVNGILQTLSTATDGTGSRPSDATDNLYIGNLGTSSENWDGKIDEVKLYNYVRTQSQVAYDYNRGAPIAWWKFDECQGSTLNDSSGNGFNAPITIGAGAGTGHIDSVGTCNTSSTSWGNGQSGKFNSSLYLDGIDDYANPYSSAFNTAFNKVQGTFSGWAKVSSSSIWTDGLTHHVAEFATDANNGIYIRKRASNNQFEAIYKAGGTSINPIFTFTSPPTDWFHVALTWDKTADQVKFYINGVQVVVTQAGLGVYAGNLGASNTKIGAADAVIQTWSGQLDDMRVYNYALSATQIKEVYNQGSGVRFGPTSGQP